jgi:2'-hydroxyisoflavone reductase
VKVLVLGGTRFVGRHVAATALARGWDVSLFNRGVSDPDAFPDAEHLVGDRDGGLAALAGRRWDAVVDTSGFVPRVVGASAAALAGSAGRYVFVSSAGVYADKSAPGLTENAPVEQLGDPSTEDVGAHYDGLKALCEQVVVEAYGDRATVVRPGLIAGPHDPTNRFTYWVTRISRGGAVLAPEPRDQPVQVIDARDLAAWMLDLAEGDIGGTFNAVGEIHTMEAVLHAIDETVGDSPADFVWIPEARLLEAGLEEWSDVPLWLAPGANPSYAGFLAIDHTAAKRAGLTLRPLADTIRDTWAWACDAPPPTGTTRGGAEAPPAGLDPVIEARLIDEEQRACGSSASG